MTNNAYTRFPEINQQAGDSQEMHVSAIEEGVGLSIIMPYKGWTIDIALQHKNLGGATDVRVYDPNGSEVHFGLAEFLKKATADTIRAVLCNIDCVISHV